jgi:hypothetical protein
MIRQLTPSHRPGTLPHWIATIIGNVIYASARAWPE